MTEHVIRICSSEDKVRCPEATTILDACLAHGLPMPYNCRSGECGECIADLRAGEIEELPGADPAVFTDGDRASGRILTCMCYPRSDLEIDIKLRDGIAAPKIEHVSGVVEDIRRHGQNVVEIRLATPRPLDYRPGQYFAWRLPGIAPNRSFSAATRPGGDAVVFHVRIYPDGKVGDYVKARLALGDTVDLIGPYGHFGFTENDHRPAICVAGGTGMAPLHAALDAAFHAGDRRSIRYFYGARTQQDLYCLDSMAAWQAAHPTFRFVPVLSDEPPDSGWTGERGLVTDVLSREIGAVFGAEGYLCGPPAMIDAAIEICLTAGLLEDDIYYDKFAPAK